MFEYQQNTLCVAASWLYEDLSVFSKDYYLKLAQRGKLQRIQTGGNGRRALVAYESIPERFKNKIREIVGDPYEQVKHIIFADYIKPDLKADEFFASYLLEDGTHLP
ncbi:MAG TPA: hypothetical protein VKY44_05905, partial [Flavobacterium sp.]|nr:hypothetical protein [Flavobacterium sp.]